MTRSTFSNTGWMGWGRRTEHLKQDADFGSAFPTQKRGKNTIGRKYSYTSHSFGTFVKKKGKEKSLFRNLKTREFRRVFLFLLRPYQAVGNAKTWSSPPNSLSPPSSNGANESANFSFPERERGNGTKIKTFRKWGKWGEGGLPEYRSLLLLLLPVSHKTFPFLPRFCSLPLPHWGGGRLFLSVPIILRGVGCWLGGRRGRRLHNIHAK